MTELLTIIAIGGVLLGIAVATYETITMFRHRHKLDRFAAAHRRVSDDLRRASK